MAHWDELRDIRCVVCGTMFVSNNYRAKYCSRTCERKARYGERICPICGKMYLPKKQWQKCCSTECGHKSQREKCHERKA